MSGYRALEFRCDAAADRPCPTGGVHRRCGRVYVTLKPQDIMLDDMVSGTTAGTVMPLEYPVRVRKQRFWVLAEDRDRYLDLSPEAPDDSLPDGGDEEPQPLGRASPGGPTCRPRAAPGHHLGPGARPGSGACPDRPVPPGPGRRPVPWGGNDVPRAVPAVTDDETRLHTPGSGCRGPWCPPSARPRL